MVWSSGPAARKLPLLLIARETISGEKQFQAETPLGASALHSGGRWCAGMGDRGDKLFGKICCYFSVGGEGFEGKGDGLIERSFSMFSIKGFVQTS